MSPAGYITHHCSAVSAALDSAKHRTPWSPGYATGAHVQAGCLPDHQSTVAELISTPTLSALYPQHAPRYVYSVLYTQYIYLGAFLLLLFHLSSIKSRNISEQIISDWNQFRGNSKKKGLEYNMFIVLLALLIGLEKKNRQTNTDDYKSGFYKGH